MRFRLLRRVASAPTVRVNELVLVVVAVLGLSGSVSSQTPGTSCGGGCTWKHHARIGIAANPCVLLGVCIEGCVPEPNSECGSCFPQPCAATGSVFAPTTSNTHLLCSQTSPTAGCDVLGPPGPGGQPPAPLVEARKFPCKDGPGGCVCRSEAAATIVACPCSLPSPALHQVCY